MKKLSTTAKVLIGVGIAGVVVGGTAAVVSAIKKSQTKRPPVPPTPTGTGTTSDKKDKKTAWEILSESLGLVERGVDIYGQLNQQGTPAAATESAEGKVDGGVKFVLKDGIVVPEKN